MIKEKLYENIIVPPCMKITLPKSGFTRYLAQSKVGEAYMKSDMNTNFVFIEPFNKKVFKIFSSDEKERNELYEEWNKYLINNDKYICQNFEFISEDYQDEIDNIFENPTEELAHALQDITETLLIENPKFEVCIGVVHGRQLTDEGIRYPHAHILLRKKVKHGNKK